MARNLLLPLLLVLASFTNAATTQRDLLVHFDKDQSMLTPSAIVELDEFIRTLPINGDYHFTVHGHTDSDGSAAYNIALSQARADAVLNYLVQHGVSMDLVNIDRSGEVEPIAANRNNEGMALNRRVRVTFTRTSFADTEELRNALMAGSVQHFNLDPCQRNVITGTDGTQVLFEANGFIDVNGRPAVGTVDVELTEALGLQAIIAHQLSTRSGSRLLETGGMLKLKATDEEGNELRLKNSSPMQVAVPALDQQAGMQLFESPNGADWVLTNTPLETAAVTKWKEPPYPTPTSLPFKWPYYSEDQKDRPMKPVEPLYPNPPKEPKRSSYTAAKPWWAFLFPERAKMRSEIMYANALTRYQMQLKRHTKKSAAYDLECSNYPERMERYAVRKAAWDSLKQTEYHHWKETVHKTAQVRYAAIMAPKRAKHDSLVREWQRARAESMEDYAISVDRSNSGDISSLNAYVFSTTDLGWINCDRFYGTPTAEQYSVVADGRTQTDAQVFVVFNRIKSMLQLTKSSSSTYSSASVPRTEPATLFAYTVIDGQVNVCMQPISPSTRPELIFEPSSFVEIGELLRSLGQVAG